MKRLIAAARENQSVSSTPIALLFVGGAIAGILVAGLVAKYVHGFWEFPTAGGSAILVALGVIYPGTLLWARWMGKEVGKD